MGNCISRRPKTRQQLLAAEKRYDSALAAFAAQEKQLLMVRENFRISELDNHSIKSQVQAHRIREQQLDTQVFALARTNSELNINLAKSSNEAREYQSIADAMMMERDNALVRLQDLRERTKTLANDYGSRIREMKTIMENEHESTKSLLRQFQDELSAQHETIELLTKERDDALASILELHEEDCSVHSGFERTNQHSAHPSKHRNRATTGNLDTVWLASRARSDSGVDMSDDCEDQNVADWYLQESCPA